MSATGNDAVEFVGNEGDNKEVMISRTEPQSAETHASAGTSESSPIKSEEPVTNKTLDTKSWGSCDKQGFGRDRSIMKTR